MVEDLEAVETARRGRGTSTPATPTGS